jgi:rubrerythrin
MSQIREWSQSCGGVAGCEKPQPEVQFNVVEVLRIAEELEHKAATFYLRAAERFSDPERRTICYNLAAWRARHQRTWACIRREYSERTGEFGTFDPDNYVLSNPQVMASLTCFAARPGSRNWPTGHETPEQIVRDAIHRARDAVIFYQGLKGFAQDAESDRMIDNMIDREEHHVRQLCGSLQQMRSRRSLTCASPVLPVSRLPGAGTL